MTNNPPRTTLAFVLVILLSLLILSCSLFSSPAFPLPAPTSTATSTATFTPTASPFPAIYVTLNVNEFAAYTVFWKRELWEQAIGEHPSVEDFENDNGDYGELTFPYLTGNGLLLQGKSAAQILDDGSLLSSGNLLHFRDWQGGLKLSFPNNLAVSALSFDYAASEIWQLAFNNSVISIPKGRNRFVGVIIRDAFPVDFVLSSPERVQGGLSIDNISYIPISNATAVPSAR